MLVPCVKSVISLLMNNGSIRRDLLDNVRIISVINTTQKYVLARFQSSAHTGLAVRNSSRCYGHQVVPPGILNIRRRPQPLTIPVIAASNIGVGNLINSNYVRRLCTFGTSGAASGTIGDIDAVDRGTKKDTKSQKQVASITELPMTRIEHVHAPGSPNVSAVDPIYDRFTVSPAHPTVATGAAAGQLRHRFTALHSEQPQEHHTQLYDITQTAVELAHLTASNAKYYTDAATSVLNKRYLNIEETLLARITAKNRRYVRFVLVSILATIFLIIVVFGTKIRQKVTTSTASIAKETLENESLKDQTQQLAMAVVQTILTDKEVTVQAANFLKEASTTPETQEALLALTLHCLRHPDSLDSLTTLVQELLVRLSADPEARASVVAFGGRVCADEQLLAELKGLVLQILTDKQLNAAVNDILLAALQLPEVNAATTAVLHQSAKDLLQDSELKGVTREFITQVVGDSALQRESGAALYNSITHALTPGTIKMVGLGLIAVSVAFIEVMISGY